LLLDLVDPPRAQVCGARAGDLLILSPAFLMVFNSVFSWVALRLVMPGIINFSNRSHAAPARKF
jgi:hypothetical protein